MAYGVMYNRLDHLMHVHHFLQSACHRASVGVRYAVVVDE